VKKGKNEKKRFHLLGNIHYSIFSFKMLRLMGLINTPLFPQRAPQRKIGLGKKTVVMPPPYFSELFHLKPHVNSMPLNLICSHTDSFSSGIQAVIGTESFFFDINFYLMVTIATDFKIPVNTFSKLLSRKEKK